MASETMTVRLPDNLAKQVKEAATRGGKSVNRFVVETLSEKLSLELLGERADVALADFIGCLPPRETDSSKVSEIYADDLVKRHKAGRL